MKKLNKKFLSLFLCFVLLLGGVLPYHINASETITIDLKRNPKIDIVLTSKDTNLDLSTFEEDILMKLNECGINTNNVDISTVSSENISTNNTDASTVFNSWNKFGNAGKWTLTTYSGSNVIYNSENTWGVTGYYAPDNMDLRDMTLEYDFMPSDSDNDFVGVILRFNMEEDLSSTSKPLDTKVSGYWYWECNKTSQANAWKALTGLYKANNAVLPSDSYTTNNTNGYYSYNGTTYNKGGLGSYYYHYGGTAKGYTYTAAIEQPYAWKMQDGITQLVNASANHSWTKYNAWTHYKFQVKNNTITIWRDGVEILNYTDDSEDPINKGSFALINMSQASRYRNFVASYSYYKTFDNILREPNWRDDADHFIVNVDEVVDESFTNATSMGEILTRTINDDIDFIQWGSDANQSVMERFIKQNNDNGVFFNESEYETLIENTANYIANQYQRDDDGGQYVIVNTPTDLEVTPSELATNTSDEEYPNGKWIIHHNAKYFANGTGQSEYSEQYQNDLNIVFDKPGEYTIYYGEDLVKTIYAHRKPIANFTMSLNNDKTLNLVNTSYDLDSNVDTYGFGNGIVDVSWKWKKLSDETWTNGQPTFALEIGESYVIQLSVVDEQGAESTYTSKYITLEENAKIPPIAAFNYTNSTIFTNNELEIINTSYDPAGNDITGYSWVLKKGNTTISTTSEPVVDFNTSTLGAGEYSYTLTVTNSLGLTSEAFTKSFTVIEDTIPPSVMIDPTYSDWGDSSVINFEFMDSGSGFAKFRYTHSATQTPPSDSDVSWSEWSTNDNGSLTIDEDGVWYLHLQAQDNNGNILNRTVGVYRIDTTNPIIERVDIDETSVERVIPITVIASDATSGLKKNAYRFVNENSGEDSGYIDSNTYNATTNGIFTIYVKDQNNNEVSIETREITKVDRVAPEILTFSTSTDQWAKSVDTQISAQDAFSGMNTYSYALEKLVVEEDDDNLDVASIGLDNLLSKDVYAQELSDVTLIPIDVDGMDLTSLSWQEDDTFTITENGTYNLYARDMADNVSAVQFTIDNVDTTPPTIEKVEYSTQDVTNQDVIITVVGAKDESVGLHEKPYSYDNGTTWVKENTFSVKGNGEFSVLVRDALENTSTHNYKVENIDKILPSLEDIDVVSNREERKSTITFSVNDDRELYGYVLKNSSALPSNDEYNTSFEVDENGNVSDETTLTANGTYYLFVKDIGGNVFSQKIVIDALVTGIDITQNQMTEYQELTNKDNANPIALFSDGIDVEGKHDTFVYVSQQSTFSAIIPKTIILDGQSGVGSYETSVVGNIAGVETIGILPTSTFSLKDVANVKTPINASVTQAKTSFGFDEILTKTTTTGTINAPDITAGSWRGELIFNILVQNNQNTIDSIASVESDSFGLIVDDSAIEITNE